MCCAALSVWTGIAHSTCLPPPRITSPQPPPPQPPPPPLPLELQVPPSWGYRCPAASCAPLRSPPLPAYRTSRHVICEGTADGHLAPCHLAPAHAQDEEDRLACLLVKERHEHEEARVAALEGSAAAGLAAEGPPMPGGGAASRKKCMSGMLRRAGKTREDFPTVQMTRAIDESNRELAQEVR